MSESKELLEATIKGLEEKLESVKSDLSMKVRELDDVEAYIDGLDYGNIESELDNISNQKKSVSIHFYHPKGHQTEYFN